MTRRVESLKPGMVEADTGEVITDVWQDCPDVTWYQTSAGDLVMADNGALVKVTTEEAGDRFTGPNGELIHAEIRIADSMVMITEDAVDGPVSS